MSSQENLSLLKERRKKTNDLYTQQAKILMGIRETTRRSLEREKFSKLSRAKSIYDTAYVMVNGLPSTTNPFVIGEEIKVILHLLKESFPELDTEEKKVKLSTLLPQFKELENGKPFLSVNEAHEFVASFVVALLSK